MSSLVSIIIPCYNSSRYLSETLTNILSQTHSNFECLVIDDGSTDDTSLIARSFAERDNRIRYYSQENAGSAAARNKGIELSKGEFFQFIDADDLIHPEKVKIQVEYLLENSTIDVAFGQVVLFNGSEEVNFNSVVDCNNNYTKRLNGRDQEVLKYLVLDNIMAIHAALFRSKIIRSIGIFDTNLKSCEDYDFWFRAALAHFNFSYNTDPRTTCYYRKHIQNKSYSSSRMSYYRSLVIQKHLNAVRSDYPELYGIFFDRFLLNQRKYLFGKDKKNLSDLIYTFKLAFRHRSIRLLLINFQYMIIPNRVWSLVYWNGGLVSYLKIKLQGK